MLHARTDYDAIQPDPNDGPFIPSDEPVMLFRGQDVHAPILLGLYAALLDRDGNEAMADAVWRHRHRMIEWQQQHNVKSPDMPAGAAR